MKRLLLLTAILTVAALTGRAQAQTSEGLKALANQGIEQAFGARPTGLLQPASSQDSKTPQVLPKVVEIDSPRGNPLSPSSLRDATSALLTVSRLALLFSDRPAAQEKENSDNFKRFLEHHGLLNSVRVVDVETLPVSHDYIFESLSDSGGDVPGGMVSRMVITERQIPAPEYYWGGPFVTVYDVTTYLNQIPMSSAVSKGNLQTLSALLNINKAAFSSKTDGKITVINPSAYRAYLSNGSFTTVDFKRTGWDGAKHVLGGMILNFDIVEGSVDLTIDEVSKPVLVGYVKPVTYTLYFSEKRRR